MKTKFNLLAVAGIVLMLAFAACGSQENKPTTTEQNTATAKIQYTCPMHPEVISDKPGKCPKCGMELVEKKSDDTKK